MHYSLVSSTCVACFYEINHDAFCGKMSLWMQHARRTTNSSSHCRLRPNATGEEETALMCYFFVSSARDENTWSNNDFVLCYVFPGLNATGK
jgi:hypothetical protein